MKKAISFLLLGLLLNISFIHAQEWITSGEKDVDSLVNDQNKLAFQLYSLIKGKENTVISPYAITYSLALAFEGAGGSTESQMARILQFRLDKELLIKSYTWLNDRWLMESPFFFFTGLWVQRGIIKPEFLKVVEKEMKATLRQGDFASRSESAKSEMNIWFKEKSQGKLTNIIQANDLNNLVKMIAVSGSYIRGKWQQGFDSRNTKQVPFFRDRFITSTVPSMSTVGIFNCFEDGNWTVVELPYESKKKNSPNISLLVILPHETYGLKNIENEVTWETVKQWLSAFQKQRVFVTIPRFQTTGTFSLVEVFRQMGLNNPFGDEADFEGIRPGNELKLSKIFHKAQFSIDEGGSNGGVSFSNNIETGSSSEKDLIIFKADHPFMFILMDKSINSILMIGKVMSP